jgi:hypothetical protein
MSARCRLRKERLHANCETAHSGAHCPGLGASQAYNDTLKAAQCLRPPTRIRRESVAELPNSRQDGAWEIVASFLQKHDTAQRGMRGGGGGGGAVLHKGLDVTSTTALTRR